MELVTINNNTGDPCQVLGMSFLHPFTSINWSASLVPTAAVITGSTAHVKVVAVRNFSITPPSSSRPPSRTVHQRPALSIVGRGPIAGGNSDPRGRQVCFFSANPSERSLPEFEEFPKDEPRMAHHKHQQRQCTPLI